MPKDAPVDVGAPGEPIVGPFRRISEMQAKLHRWAAADPGRRFDDLFNFVCDPATLLVAFDRVAGNHGANTRGIDGLTAVHVEEVVGLSGFLDDLRTCLKDGSFRPLPVRVLSSPLGTEPIRGRLEISLENRFQHQLQRSLNDPVRNRRDGCFILLLLQSRVGIVGPGVELCWSG
jgi:retron-type reverse transcriptase